MSNLFDPFWLINNKLLFTKTSYGQQVRPKTSEEAKHKSQVQVQSHQSSFDFFPVTRDINYANIGQDICKQSVCNLINKKKDLCINNETKSRAKKTGTQ